MHSNPRRLDRRLVSSLVIAAAVTSAAADVPANPTTGYDFEATRELVGRVVAAARAVEEKGLEAACVDFRTSGSEWFHGEVYVFVLGLDGEALCHPSQPRLQGRSLVELRDPHGRPIVRNFQHELEENQTEGWVHYLWPKPGDPTFYWKSTYVRRARAGDRDVIVGSGLYSMPTERRFVVDQVEDAARLVERDGPASFPTLRARASGFRFLDAYVFVMREDGVEVVNVGFPELEGVNLLDFQDSQGKLVSREMLRMLDDRDATWVEYMWPKPGEGLPSRKSSYVRRVRFDGTLYVVGAGVYLPEPAESGSRADR